MTVLTTIKIRQNKYSIKLLHAIVPCVPRTVTLRGLRGRRRCLDCRSGLAKMLGEGDFITCLSRIRPRRLGALKTLSMSVGKLGGFGGRFKESCKSRIIAEINRILSRCFRGNGMCEVAKSRCLILMRGTSCRSFARRMRNTCAGLRGVDLKLISMKCT